jgi:hypothetical protein
VRNAFLPGTCVVFSVRLDYGTTAANRICGRPLPRHVLGEPSHQPPAAHGRSQSHVIIVRATGHAASRRSPRATTGGAGVGPAFLPDPFFRLHLPRMLNVETRPQACSYKRPVCSICTVCSYAHEGGSAVVRQSLASVRGPSECSCLHRVGGTLSPASLHNIPSRPWKVLPRRFPGNGRTDYYSGHQIVSHFRDWSVHTLARTLRRHT